VIDPTAIFLQAQRAWIARVVPPYESFKIECAQTFLAAKCGAGDVVAFTVRTSDGRAFAQAIPAEGGTPRVLLRGAFITGPAGTPLGFYRVLPSAAVPPPPPPPNLVPDPLATIATVTANSHAYDVSLGGEETIDGRLCYHLRLQPRTAPERYPLRDLWVEESSSQVVALTYERPYDERDTWASVRYRFAPRGPNRIWAIVHVEAEAVSHGVFSEKTERVSDDLRDIGFPATAPAWYFQPEGDCSQAGASLNATPCPAGG